MSAPTRSFNPITGIDYATTAPPKSSTLVERPQTARNSKLLSRSFSSSVFKDGGPGDSYLGRPLTAHKAQPSSDVFNLSTPSTPAITPRNHKKAPIDDFTGFAGQGRKDLVSRRALCTVPESKLVLTDSIPTEAPPSGRFDTNGKHDRGRKAYQQPIARDQRERLGFGSSLSFSSSARFQPVGEVKHYNRSKKLVEGTTNCYDIMR